MLDVEIISTSEWESEDVTEPTVVKRAGTYHMYYTGYDGLTSRIGHATSSDGITWIKDETHTVLDIADSGKRDWLGVYSPRALRVGDKFKLWYSGWTLPQAWQTGYALSRDGSNWLRRGLIIQEGGPGDFDLYGADHSSVLTDGPYYKIWYTALGAGGGLDIGTAHAGVCEHRLAYKNTTFLPAIMKVPGSCKEYYNDNFSDPSSGWPLFEDSDLKYGYTGGQYQTWLKTDGSIYVTPGAKAEGYTLAVDARRTSGNYGSYGILFQLRETKDDQWNEFYIFLVERNTYSIWKFEWGSWYSLTDWTYSPHINSGTSWNRLKVSNDTINTTVYVNGHQLATVMGYNFPGLGRAGFVALTPLYGSSLDARFDNFVMAPGGCGAQVASPGLGTASPGILGTNIPPLRSFPGGDVSWQVNVLDIPSDILLPRDHVSPPSFDPDLKP